MSIGTGLFLSAVFLGCVILYVATKDRWNWKRLVKYALGVPVFVVLLGGLGLWGYSTYENRTTAPDEFFGLKLGTSLVDVRFAKGEPSQAYKNERWTYDVGSAANGVDSAQYLIRFKDERIRYILYSAIERESHPLLQNFQRGSSYEAVMRALGQPSSVTNSENGLTRILSFEKYKTFYIFSKGEVAAYGIYDPKSGPVEFSTTPEPPQVPPSGVKVP